MKILIDCESDILCLPLDRMVLVLWQATHYQLPISIFVVKAVQESDIHRVFEKDL